MSQSPSCKWDSTASFYSCWIADSWHTSNRCTCADKAGSPCRSSPSDTRCTPSPDRSIGRIGYSGSTIGSHRFLALRRLPSPVPVSSLVALLSGKGTTGIVSIFVLQTTPSRTHISRIKFTLFTAKVLIALATISLALWSEDNTRDFPPLKPNSFSSLIA